MSTQGAALQTPSGGAAARKRQRTSSDNDNAQSSQTKKQKSAPTPHSTLRFEDGNIVLIAQNTYFRVHKGILMHHSEVMKDMFQIPQPAYSAADLIEGCPIVHMSDTASDIELFLLALYDGGSKYFDSTKPLDFQVVAAMLRMGQKYSVESLIKGGTDRLKAFFPASLEDYDTRFNDGTDWFVDHWYSGSASHGPPENISIYMGLEDAIKVIPLLQHFELKECLPAAFYFLSQIPEDELIEAVEGGRLSFENLKCCTDGRSYLREAYVHGMEAVLSQKRSAKSGGSVDLNISVKTFASIAALVLWITMTPTAKMFGLI
ncbi:hypothetical protein NLI96_g9499 [Meripilus lineatus]|uniref:BTB domain-containing protein n=1 Tax=Meripilus lineatus TaxID=2056292 RepID=A0AAD5UVH2_9APHY|nr:hypothetical protein NLI96_g9499 [Physisporinus lineatus]